MLSAQGERQPSPSAVACVEAAQAAPTPAVPDPVFPVTLRLGPPVGRDVMLLLVDGASGEGFEMLTPQRGRHSGETHFALVVADARALTVAQAALEAVMRARKTWVADAPAIRWEGATRRLEGWAQAAKTRLRWRSPDGAVLDYSGVVRWFRARLEGASA